MRRMRYLQLLHLDIVNIVSAATAFVTAQTRQRFVDCWSLIDRILVEQQKHESSIKEVYKSRFSNVSLLYEARFGAAEARVEQQLEVAECKTCNGATVGTTYY
ncbi:hypothetical protein QVD17_28659 [Tagetes erecta]|uniref:Uncharacterized protein n=1 Tax=Tagetes erecta TaxID=13708 RepID=A0AAD8KFF5_TARER|nr:hypothetical protein QVD17_28659 [Tagetes erecta]